MNLETIVKGAKLSELVLIILFHAATLQILSYKVSSHIPTGYL